MKYVLGALVLVLVIVGGILLFKGDKEPENENIGLEEVDIDEEGEDYFDIEDDSSDSDKKDDQKDDKEDKEDDKTDDDNSIDDGSEGRIF